jgi:hypothetical protein
MRKKAPLQHVPFSAICSKDHIFRSTYLPVPFCAWETWENILLLYGPSFTTTKIIPAVNITSGLEGGVAAAADSQGPTTDGNISDDELGDFLLDAVTWL